MNHGDTKSPFLQWLILWLQDWFLSMHVGGIGLMYPSRSSRTKWSVHETWNQLWYGLDKTLYPIRTSTIIYCQSSFSLGYMYQFIDRSEPCHFREVVSLLNPCISPPQLVQSYMQHSTFRVASLANARAFLISSNFFRRLSSVSGTVGSFCCLQMKNTVFEDPSKHTNTMSCFHSGKMFVDTN